jgi:hypothetical protein
LINPDIISFMEEKKDFKEVKVKITGGAKEF